MRGNFKVSGNVSCRGGWKLECRLSRKNSGVEGLAHTRFGGPGEHSPRSREHQVLRPRAFFL